MSRLSQEFGLSPRDASRVSSIVKQAVSDSWYQAGYSAAEYNDEQPPSEEEFHAMYSDPVFGADATGAYEEFLKGFQAARYESEDARQQERHYNEQLQIEQDLGRNRFAREVSQTFREAVMDAEDQMVHFGHEPSEWRGYGNGVRNECADCAMVALVAPDGKQEGDALAYNCSPMEGV